MSTSSPSSESTRSTYTKISQKLKKRKPKLFYCSRTSWIQLRPRTVSLSGWPGLRHECHPTYLGVTLDHMLSYRGHLTKTAGKLKNQNNLLMKLAGSIWGASANTLRSSALALCYSAAEYCAPVWSHSAHTSRVDVQLNSTMCLISGTLRSNVFQH